MQRKPTYWSLTALTQYEGCPSQYEWVRIQKHRNDLSNNPAVIRGNEMHKKAENLVLGKITGIPSDLRKFSTEFRNLMRTNVSPEAELAVDKNWQPCAWNDWDRVWCISKADAVVRELEESDVIDYKSGRVRTNYEPQLELYGCCELGYSPKMEIANSELWFLDHQNADGSGLVIKKKFDRYYLEEARKEWEHRASKLLTATKYPARPSGSICRWCSRRDDKGGDCNRWRDVE